MIENPPSRSYPPSLTAGRIAWLPRNGENKEKVDIANAVPVIISQTGRQTGGSGSGSKWQNKGSGTGRNDPVNTAGPQRSRRYSKLENSGGDEWQPFDGKSATFVSPWRKRNKRGSDSALYGGLQYPSSVIVMLHDTNEDAGTSIRHSDRLSRTLGCTVLTLEYSGYGFRKGEGGNGDSGSSGEGATSRRWELSRDIRTVLEFLVTSMGVDSKDIFVVAKGDLVGVFLQVEERK